MKKHLQIILILFLGISSVGCSNIFSEMSDKTTDKAIYYDAKLKLAAGKYAEAITSIGLLSETFRSQRDVQVTLASAHAGLCGLDFLEIANSLNNTTTADNGFLLLMMRAFGGAEVTDLASCRTAESILTSVGGLASRSANENLLMAFIGLSKVGVILAALGDANADSTVDPTFLVCDAGTGDTVLPDADAVNFADTTEIVTGLAIFMLNMAAVGGSVADGFYSELETLCALPELNNACSTTDRASVTAAQQLAIRSLVHDGSGVGLGIVDANGDTDGADGNKCELDQCVIGQCADM